MNLCSYRAIFGAPNTGAHSYRVFNLAIVDLLLTIAVVLLIGWMRGWNTKTSMLAILLTLIASIFIHRLFCVNTTLTKAVFGEVK
jgi:hypothetical protein